MDLFSPVYRIHGLCCFLVFVRSQCKFPRVARVQMASLVLRLVLPTTHMRQPAALTVSYKDVSAGRLTNVK